MCKQYTCNTVQLFSYNMAIAMKFNNVFWLTEINEGVYCTRNKKGKDVSFRAFLDYTPRNLYYLNKDGLFQTTVNGWTQYHWSYTKTFPTYTAVSYEYTELSKSLYDA